MTNRLNTVQSPELILTKEQAKILRSMIKNSVEIIFTGTTCVTCVIRLNEIKLRNMITNRLINNSNAAFEKQDLENATKDSKRVLVNDDKTGENKDKTNTENNDNK